MLQTTRGGQFPIVTVRTQLPEGAAFSDTVYADLEIECAGQTAHYARVPFHIVVDGDAALVSGTIPATISDFKIDPPTLLTTPIKNDIPVYVESTWHRKK